MRAPDVPLPLPHQHGASRRPQVPVLTSGPARGRHVVVPPPPALRPSGTRRTTCPVAPGPTGPGRSAVVRRQPRPPGPDAPCRASRMARGRHPRQPWLAEPALRSAPRPPGRRGHLGLPPDREPRAHHPPQGGRTTQAHRPPHPRPPDELAARRRTPEASRLPRLRETGRSPAPPRGHHPRETAPPRRPLRTGCARHPVPLLRQVPCPGRPAEQTGHRRHRHLRRTARGHRPRRPAPRPHPGHRPGPRLRLRPPHPGPRHRLRTADTVSTVSRRPALTPRQLTRTAERLSFVYLERCTVHRDANAITAQDAEGTTHIPSATIGTLLLGPGTRVTHQAMSVLGETGAAVCWVGEHGVRFYASGRALNRSSALMEAQARQWANPRSRLTVAREMYRLRFPDEDPAGLTRQELLGREGKRVKDCYRAEAARTGIPWKGRRYTPGDFSGGDPVNQ